MRKTPQLGAEAGDQSSIRILRLLSLYRIVAMVGAVALVFNEPNALWQRQGTIAFLLFYGAVHIVAFTAAQDVWRRPALSLTLMMVLDIVFVLLLTNLGGSLLFIAAIMPILVSHGWLLRNQFAVAHAAMFAIAVVFSTAFEPMTQAQSGFLGLGAFAAVFLGISLGRLSGDAMNLAEQRGEDIAKLSSLNQRIIDESDQGILVVDREGNMLQANPQAERWLFDAGVEVRLPSPLMRVSESLGVQWANWREGHTMLDSGVTLGSGESQVKVRPRFVSTELRRAGDTVIFLEDLRLAQAHAQQLKLAALGRLTANIAHEIRNPLSAVRQASQLLNENQEQQGDSDRRLAEMIEKNVRRIDRIVTNVLSLSKRDRVEPQNIDAAQVLHELVQDWHASTQAALDSVELNAEPALQIRGDAGHLEEIVWNLVSNAWRHSQQRIGSVQLTCRRGTSGRTAIIEVTDDGPGVPADHRESIFEPFFSLSSSSGLGLYISRELAESNAGTLELTRHVPGAQFRLILPALPDKDFADL